MDALDVANYIYVALLLTNYRCHDSILRLPSNLFFHSTLQVRTNSELHPKTSSALHFVCTSMKSMVASKEDCSEEEASITLQQVVMAVTDIIIVLFKFAASFSLSLCFYRYNLMSILGQKHSGDEEIYQVFVLYHQAKVR